MSHDKLKRVFIEALGIAEDTDFKSLEYGMNEKWDSVAHMVLVARIEDSFDIMLDTDDVIGLSSYTVAVEILKKQVKNFD